jgi:hypothetical protein
VTAGAVWWSTTVGLMMTTRDPPIGTAAGLSGNAI